MAVGCQDSFKTKKLKRPLDREYNTAVYLLRCKQLGFTLTELFDFDYGEIQDVIIEGSNDHAEYGYKATQTDFDNAFHS